MDFKIKNHHFNINGLLASNLISKIQYYIQNVIHDINFSKKLLENFILCIGASYQLVSIDKEELPFS